MFQSHDVCLDIVHNNMWTSCLPAMMKEKAETQDGQSKTDLGFTQVKQTRSLILTES